MSAGKNKDGNEDRPQGRQSAVPSSRVGRFTRVARLTAGVAGGMLAEGTRQWRAGNRPRRRDLLLTPGNAKRVADQLSEMRGAAMKLGQILSMDNGDMLPRELADILGPPALGGHGHARVAAGRGHDRGLRRGLGIPVQRV